MVALVGPLALARASGDARVSVRPKLGSARAQFVVSFTAQRTGYMGSSRSAYQVIASGPSGRGCHSSEEVPVPPIQQGQRVSVTLTPGSRPNRWCKGSYTGRVDEIVRPACGFRQLCPLSRGAAPMFVAVMVVGRFSFRVR
jgi:hypothetical protein